MARSKRVYEVAKELGIKSKEVLTILQDQLELDVTNHMSAINNQVAERVRRIVKGTTESEQKTKPPAEPSSRVEKATTKRPSAPDDESDLEEPAGKEPVRRRKTLKDDSPTPPKRKAKEEPEETEPRSITLSGPLTVGKLAETLGIEAIKLMQHLISQGIMASINQELDLESAASVARDLGYKVDLQVDAEEEEAIRHPSRRIVGELIEPDDPDRAQTRAPVVTVMGHVDHGKTTLLDTIRKSSVIESEMGGITQHIGASTIYHDGKPIVFLDTPGHEAFTTMRARGAQVTDIVVLVVAADDGVMPQTKEAIDHAQAAGVPIMVAVNKIDVPNAQPDRIRQELTAFELVPEEWGGDTIYVNLSALHGDNVEELLEMINLVAEIEELTGDPEKRAHGIIIESELDKGRGPVATVLIQGGTLHRGDPFVAGAYGGRVRAMFNDHGDPVDEAGPSMPVAVLGLNGVPEAGDLLVAMPSDSDAKSLASDLQEKERLKDLQLAAPVSLEDFHSEFDKDLNIILKADVHGSLDACQQALERISNEEVSVRVLHGGVGAITESDVMLASASEGVILGFNVRPTGKAQQSADQLGVDIRSYRVIYELLNDVEKAITGMLSPKYREVVIGRAEVREVFKVPNAGFVAGLYVSDGVIRRNANVRLVRDGRVIHEGAIDSLRRFKDDVREVKSGFECGLSIENYNDVRVGDEIEAFIEEEVPRG